jgi:hypothetical protein
MNMAITNMPITSHINTMERISTPRRSWARSIRGSRYVAVAYKLSMVDWAFADTLAYSLQASLHGHKPSRGAELDRELQQDDEKRLREMGLK